VYSSLAICGKTHIWDHTVLSPDRGENPAFSPSQSRCSI